MYQSHWGLRQSPFRNCLDLEYFYQNPVHEEALARLFFLVEQRRRLGLLIGPGGSGKSLLLEVFARQLRRRGSPVASLNLIGVEPAEMLWHLAAQFQVSIEPPASTAALWRAITDRIAEHRYQQQDTAILLDDADRASRPVFVQIMRLAQSERSPESRLTLILAGDPKHVGQIDHGLLDLAELRIDLEPWEQADTQQYLAKSLAQAGCTSSVFAESAVARLHTLSQGIPRRVAQLADLSLLAGAGQELEQIDAEVVEGVYRELGGSEPAGCYS